MGEQDIRPPDLIIVILPQECRPLRYEVKRYGDVHHGVATQCIVIIITRLLSVSSLNLILLLA